MRNTSKKVKPVVVNEQREERQRKYTAFIGSYIDFRDVVRNHNANCPPGGAFSSEETIQLFQTYALRDELIDIENQLQNIDLSVMSLEACREEAA